MAQKFIGVFGVGLLVGLLGSVEMAWASCSPGISCPEKTVLEITYTAATSVTDFSCFNLARVESADQTDECAADVSNGSTCTVRINVNYQQDQEGTFDEDGLPSLAPSILTKDDICLTSPGEYSFQWLYRDVISASVGSAESANLFYAYDSGNKTSSITITECLYDDSSCPQKMVLNVDYSAPADGSAGPFMCFNTLWNNTNLTGTACTPGIPAASSTCSLQVPLLDLGGTNMFDFAHGLRVGFGIDEHTPCLQTAGKYSFSVEARDRSNVPLTNPLGTTLPMFEDPPNSGSLTHTVNVHPSDPDSATSEANLMTSICSEEDIQNAADNGTACSSEFILRDASGNEERYVVDETLLQNIKICSNTGPLEGDANEGANNTRTALYFAGCETVPYCGPDLTNQSGWVSLDTIRLAQDPFSTPESFFDQDHFSLSLFSNVPTLQRMNNGGVQQVPYPLNLTLSFPSKDVHGDIDLALPTTVIEEDVVVQFSPLLEFKTEPVDSSQKFALDQPVNMKMKYLPHGNDVTAQGSPFSNLSVELFGGGIPKTVLLDEDMVPTELIPDNVQKGQLKYIRTHVGGTEVLPEAVPPPDPLLQSGRMLLNAAERLLFPDEEAGDPASSDANSFWSSTTEFEDILKFDLILKPFFGLDGTRATGTVPDLDTDGEDQLALFTRVSYDHNSCGNASVQYLSPSEGVGADPVESFGADIEGHVLHDQTIYISQFQSATNVGGSHVRDIRETINENAIRLMRGNTPLTEDQTFNNTTPLTFPLNGVRVVQGNVTLENDIIISGRKTLVVQNGNLIIKGNISYDDPETDSLGIMVVTTLPQTTYTAGQGNILVHSNVQHLVGTYFAEGALLTSDDGVNIKDPTGSTKQLLLEGTLFTQNTLGGGRAPLDNDEANGFGTPWGNTVNPNVGDLGLGLTPRAVAQRFDLHFIRQYKPILGHTCFKPDGNNCLDDNDASFVIRIDGKASELPPPGFESMDVVR